MLVIIIAILIIVVVGSWLLVKKSEGMITRRPVGYIDDPTAAKYFSAGQIKDCTACPVKRECPTCPQYNARSIEQFNAEPFSGAMVNYSEGNTGDSHVGLIGSKPVATSSGQILSTGMIFNDGTGIILQPGGDIIPGDLGDNQTETPYGMMHNDMVDGEFPYALGMMSSRSLGPHSDLDVDFLINRRHAGGGGQHTDFGKKEKYTVNNNSRFADVTNLGVRNDDLFDGERSIGLGQRTCTRSDKTTLNLLYGEVMGISNPMPSQQDCEFIGENGYLYKEDCGIW